MAGYATIKNTAHVDSDTLDTMVSLSDRRETHLAVLIAVFAEVDGASFERRRRHGDFRNRQFLHRRQVIVHCENHGCGWGKYPENRPSVHPPNKHGGLQRPTRFRARFRETARVVNGWFKFPATPLKQHHNITQQHRDAAVF